MLSLTLLATLAAAPAIATRDSVPAAPEAGKISTELARAFRENPFQDFWVKLTPHGDLTSAAGITDWVAQGAYVVDTLHQVADRTQAPVRARLDDRDVAYQAFWIANAILIEQGTQSLALELSSLPVVASIFEPTLYSTVEPLERPKADSEPNGVEWGVADIRADDVWDEFGVRGEGIVVASLDTGVQFDHPALVNQYRGHLPDGGFDHNYNWLDVTGASGQPWDDGGHGTHTMGTMVGDDGDRNQIGVAPRATWITANACFDYWCYQEDVLESAEWMLAPTDLAGHNPDSALRPDIINNSWGGSSPDDPFMDDVLAAWSAAGIFGVWAVGNGGPECDTAISPGSRPLAYAAGAYDLNGSIAEFSGRGPGAGADIKPDITAPGVNVRSSGLGASYDTLSGTSMAAPHAAGAVALLWSASAEAKGDVEATRDLLDGSARDTRASQCGGTADNNNVYGEGRLDAFALLGAAPLGRIGSLEGTVTDANNRGAIAGATISLSGPYTRETSSDARGGYAVQLPPGTYDVTVTAFGFLEERSKAVITESGKTQIDFVLQRTKRYILTGRVFNRRSGERLPNALVAIEGTPLSQVTNATGRYRIKHVPEGTYDITASANGCFKPHTKRADIDGTWPVGPAFAGDERKRLRLGPNADHFGYTCSEEVANYVEGDTSFFLRGDEVFATVEFPFGFPYYGNVYSQAEVASNGEIHFDGWREGWQFVNTPLPYDSLPNAIIAPFWDDLILDAESSVWTSRRGDAFTIEWRNATFYGVDPSHRIDFEVTLWRSGEILFTYRHLAAGNGREGGISATVGIENENGTVGLQYSLNEAELSDLTAIRIHPPGTDQP